MVFHMKQKKTACLVDAILNIVRLRINHLIQKTWTGPFPIRFTPRESPYMECPICGSDKAQKGHLLCGLCYVYGGPNVFVIQRNLSRLRTHARSEHEMFHAIAAHELLTFVQHHKRSGSTLKLKDAFDVEYGRQLNVSEDIFPSMTSECERRNNANHFWKTPPDAMRSACFMGQGSHLTTNVLQAQWTRILSDLNRFMSGNFEGRGLGTYKNCRLYSNDWNLEWNVPRMHKLMEWLQIDNIEEGVDSWAVPLIQSSQPLNPRLLNPRYRSLQDGQSRENPIDLEPSDRGLSPPYSDHNGRNSTDPDVQSSDDDVQMVADSMQQNKKDDDHESEDDDQESEDDDHESEDDDRESEKEDQDIVSDPDIQSSSAEEDQSTPLNAVVQRTPTPFDASSGNDEEDPDGKQAEQPESEQSVKERPSKVRRTKERNLSESVQAAQSVTISVEELQRMQAEWQKKGKDTEREKRRKKKARKRKAKEDCRPSNLRKDRDDRDRDPDQHRPRFGRGRGKPNPKRMQSFSKATKGPKASTSTSRKSNKSRKRKKRSALGCPKGFGLLSLRIRTPSPSLSLPDVESPLSTPTPIEDQNDGDSADSGRSKTVEYCFEEEVRYDCPYSRDTARWSVKERYAWYHEAYKMAMRRNVPEDCDQDSHTMAMDQESIQTVNVEAEPSAEEKEIVSVRTSTVQIRKRRELPVPMVHFQLNFEEEVVSTIHARTTPSQSTRKSVRTMSGGLVCPDYVKFWDIASVPIFTKVQTVSIVGRLVMCSLAHTDSLIVDEDIELIVCRVAVPAGVRVSFIDASEIKEKNPFFWAAYKLSMCLTAVNCDRDHSLRASFTNGRLGRLLGLDHAVRIVTDRDHDLDRRKSVVLPTATCEFHPLDPESTSAKLTKLLFEADHFTCAEPTSWGTFTASYLFERAEIEHFWKWGVSVHDLIREDRWGFALWFEPSECDHDINPMRYVMDVLLKKSFPIHIKDMCRKTMGIASPDQSNDAGYSVRLSIEAQKRLSVRSRKKAFTEHELHQLHSRSPFFIDQDRLEFVRIKRDKLLSWINQSFPITWVCILVSIFYIPFNLDGKCIAVRDIQDVVVLRPAIVLKIVYEASSVIIATNFVKWTVLKQRRCLGNVLNIVQHFIHRCLRAAWDREDGWSIVKDAPFTKRLFMDTRCTFGMRMPRVRITNMNWKAFRPMKCKTVIDLCDDSDVVLISTEDNGSAEKGYGRRRKRRRRKRKHVGRFDVDPLQPKVVSLRGSRYAV